MQWYFNVLARRPYLIVLFITVFCTACIIVSLTTNSLPDFTDPTLGFETRGTQIGKRLIAWHNLIQETGPSNELVADPNDLIHLNHNINNFGLNGYHSNSKNRNRKHRRRGKHRQRKNQITRNRTNKYKFSTYGTRLRAPSEISQNRSKYLASEADDANFKSNSIIAWHGDSGSFKDYEVTNDTALAASNANRSENRDLGIYGFNMTFVDEDDHRERIQTKKSTWILLQRAEVPESSENAHIPIEGYFCDSPAKEYAHFIVEELVQIRQNPFLISIVYWQCASCRIR